MVYRQKTGARRTAVMLLVSLSVALLLALTLARNSAGAAGGPFSGSYSGTYASSLTGSGTATFIGSSSITSRFHCGSGSCLASATLRSSAHPTDSLILGLFCLKPCPNPIHWHYNVTRGTGIFAKATGGGTAIYTLSGAGTGTFRATFTGTLTF
jgi:hypothetical protein